MSRFSLEQRVTALEQQLMEMKARQANGKARQHGESAEKPWLRSIGMFAGDEGMKEIFEEAMKLREKDRELARRSRVKKSPNRRVKK